jgi:hypothetical protein
VSTPTSTRSCFARCALRFVDPAFELINGKLFACGARVKVEMGFHTRLMPVFDGELVAVEPRFLRDKPPFLSAPVVRARAGPLPRPSGRSAASRRATVGGTSGIVHVWRGVRDPAQGEV